MQIQLPSSQNVLMFPESPEWEAAERGRPGARLARVGERSHSVRIPGKCGPPLMPPPPPPPPRSAGATAHSPTRAAT